MCPSSACTLPTGGLKVSHCAHQKSHYHIRFIWYRSQKAHVPNLIHAALKGLRTANEKAKHRYSLSSSEEVDILLLPPHTLILNGVGPKGQFLFTLSTPLCFLHVPALCRFVPSLRSWLHQQARPHFLASAYASCLRMSQPLNGDVTAHRPANYHSV